MTAPRMASQLFSLLLLTVVTAGPVAARQGEAPRSYQSSGLEAVQSIVSVQLPPVDLDTLATKSIAHTKPGPSQVAEGLDISFDLDDGTWEEVEGGRLWRLRFDAPGALHLNFGFATFQLPPGATLHIISVVDPAAYVGPYTINDPSPEGLWTPMVPGDSAVVELFVPVGAAEPVLEITRVGLGFVDLFGLRPAPKHELDGCHIDVVCPQSFMDDQERAVVALFIDNKFICTGTLLNDVLSSGRPLILTAHHCKIGPQHPPSSVVALFNFKTTSCGSSQPGSTAQTVSGTTLLASRKNVDGTLLQLYSSPPLSFNAFLAGWDHSNIVPYATSGISHPAVPDTPIATSMTYAEDNDPPLTVDSCIDSGGVSSHWEVRWDLGTTLKGSSGSALFDQNSRRVIGHLSGGDAACSGTAPNGLPDCYGKFGVFWDGPTSSERLRDWLDPQNSGLMSIDGINSPLCSADVWEPDNSLSEATVIIPSLPKIHSICPSGDVDWSTFVVTEESSIVLQTYGQPPGDTRMWLRDAGGTEIEFNDDIDYLSNRFSRIARACGADAVPAGTYFVEVDEYQGNDEIRSYGLILTTTPCSCSSSKTLANQTLSGYLSYFASNIATLGPNLMVAGPNISVSAPKVRILPNTRISGTFSISTNTPCP